MFNLDLLKFILRFLTLPPFLELLKRLNFKGLILTLVVFSFNVSLYFQSKINGILKIFPFEIKEFSFFNSSWEIKIFSRVKKETI